MKKIILLILMFLITINIVFAIGKISNDMNYLIRVTTNTGSILTGTFKFNLSITDDNTCATQLYSWQNTMTTDDSGVVNITLPNVNLPFNDTYYLCYHRDNVLKETQKIGKLGLVHRANVSDSLNPLNNYKVSNLNITQTLNVTGESLFNSNIYVTGKSYLGEINGTLGCGNITGAVSNLCTITSGGGAGDKWVDSGVYISPNTTFATQVNASGFFEEGVNINTLYGGFTYIDTRITNNVTGTDSDITNNRTAIESYLGTRIDNNITGVDSDINTNYTVLDTRITNEITGLNSDIINNGTEDRTYADARINNNMTNVVKNGTDSLLSYLRATKLNISGTDNILSLGFGNLTGVPTFTTESYADTRISNNVTGTDSDITNNRTAIESFLGTRIDNNNTDAKSYADTRITNNISRVLTNGTDSYFNSVKVNTSGTSITTSGNKTIFNSNITGNRSWNLGLSDSSFNIDDNGTTRLFIQNGTGNVGIGTTSPGSLLQVGSGTRTMTDDILTVIGASGRYSVESTTNGNNAGIRLVAKASDSTARKGGLYFIPGTTNATTYLAFTPDDSTVSMAITSTGNVGIGTTGPGYTLDVVGSIRASNTMIAGTNGIVFGVQSATGEIPTGHSILTSATSLSIAPQGASKQIVLSYYNGTQFYSALEFANVASGYGTLSLMKSGGNVGIGTTTPDSKLEVNGTVNLNDTLYVKSTTGSVGIIATNPSSSYKLTVEGSINVSGTDNRMSLGFGNLTGVPTFTTESYADTRINANTTKLDAAIVGNTSTRLANNTNAYFTNLYIGASASPYGFALTSTTATSANFTDKLYINATGSDIKFKLTNKTYNNGSQDVYVEYWNGTCYIEKNLIGGSYTAQCP